MHKIQKKILIIFLLFFIFYLINETFSLKFKEGAKGSKAKRAKAKRAKAKREREKRAARAARAKRAKAAKPAKPAKAAKPAKPASAAAKKKKAAAAAAAATAAAAAAAAAATAAAKKNIIAHCKNTPWGKYKRYKMYKNNTLLSGCNVCKKKEKRKCIELKTLKIHEATCKTSVCKRAYGEQMSDRFKIPGEIFDENKNPCMQIDFCKNCKKCNDGVDAGDFDCKKCIETEQTISSSSGGWLSWFF
jgi:hypothetical protein